MSGRGGTAAFLAAVETRTLTASHLVDVYLDDGTVRMTDAHRELVSGGNTYTPLGHYLGFQMSSEDVAMTTGEMTLSVSGIDQTFISSMLNERYLNRRVVLQQILFDGDLQIVADAVILFDGNISDQVITDNPGNKSAIAFKVSNVWSRMSRKRGRHTNTNEQQFEFPGDLGFDFSADNNPVLWGKS